MADDDAPSDPDRAAILARRQRFIALALGVVGVTACRRGPQACLSVSPEAPIEDGTNDAPPRACLEVAPPEDPPTEDPPPEDPSTEAAPQPCLSPPKR